MKPVSISAVFIFWPGLVSGALGQAISTYAVGNRPSGIAFDRTYIHVANDDDGTVSRISPKTGKIADPKRCVRVTAPVWAFLS